MSLGTSSGCLRVCSAPTPSVLSRTALHGSLVPIVAMPHLNPPPSSLPFRLLAAVFKHYGGGAVKTISNEKLARVLTCFEDTDGSVALLADPTVECWVGVHAPLAAAAAVGKGFC